MLNIIKRLLVALILVPIFLEIGLRLVDPWGMGRYIDNLRSVYATFAPDEARDFVMRPGHYTFRGWSATILPDGSRLVPGTNVQSPCTVILAGDSLTFGMGVDDDQTWASLLAAQLPAVHLINTGVVSYQIDEVAATIRAFPGKVVIYLLIGNDNEQRSAIQSVPYSSYLSMYMQDLLDHPSGALYMTDDEFLGKVGSLLDRGVIIVGFDEPLARKAQARYPQVILISRYTHTLAPSDSHPDPAGHREIAASLLPLIRQLVQSRCTQVI